MPFALIGGAIAGGGSLLSGILGSNAQTDAANIAAKGAAQATNLTGQEYLDIANKLLPFLQRGTTAGQVLSKNYFGIDPSGSYDPAAPFLQPISSTIGAPPTAPVAPTLASPTDPNLINQFRASPGYDYLIKQMTDSVQNSAAGKTGAVSGNMLKALQTNAGGLADQDWWKFFTELQGGQQLGYQNKTTEFQNQNTTYGNRYNDIANNRNQIISVLQNLASGGQAAAANTGTFGMQAVNNIGSNINLGASARAAGTLGATNSYTSALSNPSLYSGINSSLNYLFGGNAAPDLTSGGQFYGDAAGAQAAGFVFPNATSY